MGGDVTVYAGRFHLFIEEGFLFATLCFLWKTFI